MEYCKKTSKRAEFGLGEFTMGVPSPQLKMPLPLSFKIHCTRQFYLNFHMNDCFQSSPSVGFPLIVTIGEHLEMRKNIHAVSIESDYILRKTPPTFYEPINIQNATSNSMLHIAG